MYKRIMILSMITLLLVGTVGFLTAQTQQQPEGQQEGQPEGQQGQPPAAEDVTDEELQQFSDVYTVVQEIQEDLNQEVSKMIEDSSFDEQTFHNLFQAQSTGDQSATEDLSDAEQQEFEELTTKITEMQNAQQENMVAAVEDEGLTVERFNGILSAMQQDTELFEKFQEIHGEE
ncbi:MAG: DUF4168 domain-containing protein [Spirochaetia bacterium]